MRPPKFARLPNRWTLTFHVHFRMCDVAWLSPQWAQPSRSQRGLSIQWSTKSTTSCQPRWRLRWKAETTPAASPRKLEPLCDREKTVVKSKKGMGNHWWIYSKIFKSYDPWLGGNNHPFTSSFGAIDMIFLHPVNPKKPKSDRSRSLCRHIPSQEIETWQLGALFWICWRCFFFLMIF